eukprot:CAMPEP_0202963564 /NCGR_PEP_ID=MMETSP1396-20130829/7574_1 /ASSEMBLY_ACC=CAM_ASM_000872 /TAXON_ID= /ORGANISM="Pseudokeronopsis sp., Strain Brazil" /LENGTH=119 /DNA_ID=CAMNT_0049684897 /DNA_START=91 /DNA_END=450 /DNA_ORIENTATION=+
MTRRQALLWDSIQSGDLDYIKEFLQANTDTNFNINGELNGHGWAPLHEACYYGHLNIVKYLVEDQQADVNSANVNGWHSLTFAVLGGQIEIVDYLLYETIVDFRLKDKTDKDAEQIAIE